MSDTPAAGDAVLLQLMWLASPALPVGGFSYSEALEAAVDDGRVTNEASAADWLVNQMALAPARADLPVLAQAHAAWRRRDLARVTQLNDFIGRTRETRELRLQSEQMGRSLVEWLRRQPTLQALPLVVYSSREISEAEMVKLRLGPTEFLDKAKVRPKEVEELVLKMVKRLHTPTAAPAA